MRESHIWFLPLFFCVWPLFYFSIFLSCLLFIVEALCRGGPLSSLSELIVFCFLSLSKGFLGVRLYFSSAYYLGWIVRYIFAFLAGPLILVTFNCNTSPVSFSFGNCKSLASLPCGDWAHIESSSEIMEFEEITESLSILFSIDRSLEFGLNVEGANCVFGAPP